MSPETLESEENLTAFLAAFECHTLPKTAFTHAAHVTVAACYLHASDAGEVLPKMRAAISSFNESVGGANTETAGYHETLTVFWLRLVEDLLRQNSPASHLASAQLAVATFGESRGLHKDYYSGDVVTDRRARREWVEPDLQPLPIWCR
jgi:hypothetical protein